MAAFWLSIGFTYMCAIFVTAVNGSLVSDTSHFVSQCKWLHAVSHSLLAISHLLRTVSHSLRAVSHSVLLCVGFRLTTDSPNGRQPTDDFPASLTSLPLMQFGSLARLKRPVRPIFLNYCSDQCPFYLFQVRRIEKFVWNWRRWHRRRAKLGSGGGHFLLMARPPNQSPPKRCHHPHAWLGTHIARSITGGMLIFSWSV